MVRGLAILFIWTLFMQAITGSILGQFTSSEKKDKTKMLQYLRGMLKLDATTTTVKANVIKRAESWMPTTAKPEQIWDSQPSTDKRDKSKMLAYLRGMKSPSNRFNIYDAQTEGPIRTNQNAEINPNTETLNSQKATVPLLINLDKSGESEQQVLWENAGATQVTFLQPAEKDKDSGTCFWRGQQPYSTDLQGADPYASRVSLKKVQPYDIEDIGENISAAWDCVQKKFWISYDKIKKKVCGIFQR